MPFYDYTCSKCKKIIEIFHNMDDKTQHFCVDCKITLTKKIGNTIFELKGNCWSKDNYSSNISKEVSK